MSENKKDKILELRNKGYTYNQIVEETGYSKGLISYHCNELVKVKTRDRQRKLRQSNPLIKKVEFFLSKNMTNYIYTNSKLSIIHKILYRKIRTFIRNAKDTTMPFTVQELKDKIGPNPTCYLTGRPIDLSKSRTYELDHIIPSSRGGSNSIENCGLACRDANRAKADMTLDEFKTLCNDVVNNLK